MTDHLIRKDEARSRIVEAHGEAGWRLFFRWHDSWPQYRREQVEEFLSRDLSPYLSEKR